MTKYPVLSAARGIEIEISMYNNRIYQYPEIHFIFYVKLFKNWKYLWAEATYF